MDNNYLKTYCRLRKCTPREYRANVKEEFILCILSGTSYATTGIQVVHFTSKAYATKNKIYAHPHIWWKTKKSAHDFKPVHALWVLDDHLGLKIQTFDNKNHDVALLNDQWCGFGMFFGLAIKMCSNNGAMFTSRVQVFYVCAQHQHWAHNSVRVSDSAQSTQSILPASIEPGAREMQQIMGDARQMSPALSMSNRLFSTQFTDMELKMPWISNFSALTWNYSLVLKTVKRHISTHFLKWNKEGWTMIIHCFCEKILSFWESNLPNW